MIDKDKILAAKKAALEEDAKDDAEGWTDGPSIEDLIDNRIHDMDFIPEIQKEIQEIADLKNYINSFTQDLRDAMADSIDRSYITSFEDDLKKALIENVEAHKALTDGLDITELLKLWRSLIKIEKETEPPEIKTVNSYCRIPMESSIFNNSKVANQLLEIDKDRRDGYIESPINTKEGNQITVCVSMNFDDQNFEISGQPLTPYDKNIIDAACSLYLAATKRGIRPMFTLQQLYRQLNGISNIDKIDQATLEPLRNSIKKLMFKRISINATDQINYRRKTSVKKVIYESYLLPLSSLTVTMNDGTEVEGYVFLETPAIYAYSSAVNQIITVPTTLIDTSKKVRNDEEVVVVRAYLIRRIEGMKNTKNKLNSNRILYKTIFDEARIDIEDLNRAQIKRKRDKVKKILDHLVETEYIAGYEECTGPNKSILGVDIRC